MHALKVGLHLVMLYTLDGRDVAVNPNDVVTITEVEEGDGRFHQSVKCVINFIDGRFVTVAESCSEVRRKFEVDDNSQDK